MRLTAQPPPHQAKSGHGDDELANNGSHFDDNLANGGSYSGDVHRDPIMHVYVENWQSIRFIGRRDWCLFMIGITALAPKW